MVVITWPAKFVNAAETTTVVDYNVNNDTFRAVLTHSIGPRASRLK